MCMRKISGWIRRIGKNGSNSNLFGFKLVADTGTIEGPGPYISSLNFGHKWKPGVNVASTKYVDKDERDNAFFHMYTSLLDAIQQKRTKWTSWAKNFTDKNHYIIVVRPVGKLVFGLDNCTMIHTFGAKKVRWNGILIQPSCVKDRIDIYRYIPTAIADGVGLVSICKAVHPFSLYDYMIM